MTCTHLYICNEEHTAKVLSWMPFLQVGAPLHTAGNLSISSPLPPKHAQAVTGRKY